MFSFLHEQLPDYLTMLIRFLVLSIASKIEKQIQANIDKSHFKFK